MLHITQTIGNAEAVLEQLNNYRLSHDRTYRELAAEVTESCQPGRGITYAALHAILSGRKSPTDRTVYKLQRFLAARLRSKRATR